MEYKGIAINKEDKTLIDIYNIKDIEVIHFQDLVPVNQNESKRKILPSLFIIYDGGKYMLLSEKDKYFDIFVKKVYQV